MTEKEIQLYKMLRVNECFNIEISKVQKKRKRYMNRYKRVHDKDDELQTVECSGVIATLKVMQDRVMSILQEDFPQSINGQDQPQQSIE